MKLLERIPTRSTHLERSFLLQRMGMAFLAAAFPIVFLISSFVLGRTPFQTSISAYYWTLDFERNFFVGVLCALAVFLVLYKGYNRLEDTILDLAGLCAAVVAFVPMDRAGDCAGKGFGLHGAAAILLFACMFYICIFMSDHTLKEMADKNRAKRFRKAYGICATIMIGSIALAVASRFVPAMAQALCENNFIFAFEAVGVWTFSAFWYIKTRELDPSASWAPFMKKAGVAIPLDDDETAHAR